MNLPDPEYLMDACSIQYGSIWQIWYHLAWCELFCCHETLRHCSSWLWLLHPTACSNQKPSNGWDFSILTYSHILKGFGYLKKSLSWFLWKSPDVKSFVISSSERNQPTIHPVLYYPWDFFPEACDCAQPSTTGFWTRSSRFCRISCWGARYAKCQCQIRKVQVLWRQFIALCCDRIWECKCFFLSLRCCEPQVQRRSGSQELHAADTIETWHIHIESYRYTSMPLFKGCRPCRRPRKRMWRSWGRPESSDKVT